MAGAVEVEATGVIRSGPKQPGLKATAGAATSASRQKEEGGPPVPGRTQALPVHGGPEQAPFLRDLRRDVEARRDFVAEQPAAVPAPAMDGGAVSAPPRAQQRGENQGGQQLGPADPAHVQRHEGHGSGEPAGGEQQRGQRGRRQRG